MTTPAFPQLPHVQLGNTASDISSAVSSFAQGLQAERQRRRDEAMKEAMMQLQFMRLMQPDYIHQVGLDSSGNLTNQLVDKRNPLGQPINTGNAPSPQYYFPTQDNSVGAIPRQVPGAQAHIVPGTQAQPSQPGQPVSQTPIQMRDVPPVPIQIQTPQGPGTGLVDRRGHVSQPIVGQGAQHGMLPGRPSTDDEQRARNAFDMIQGKYEMRQALASAAVGRTPQEQQVNEQNAFNEAANYISSLLASKTVPVVGPLLSAEISQGQSVLSPAAARYFRAWMQATAARVFSQGGRTLTQTEADWSSASLSPKPFEDPAVTAQTERLWNGIIGGAIAGNTAWMQYRDLVKQFGFDDSQIGQNLAVPQTPVVKKNRFTGLTSH